MFETDSLDFLQHYWWCIIAILAALLVFFTFIQGGQTFLFQLGRKPLHKSLIVNVLGHKWELGFTTLVTFGGAFFASFPVFYACSFSGAYWAWILLLFCFVLQAVSYEYRSKPNNKLGSKTFDIFLFINGSLGVFLIGVIVGSMFTGAPFVVNRLQLTDVLDLTKTTGAVSGNLTAITSWRGPAHGLEALWDIQNILLGFTLVFLSRCLGLLFFINRIEDNELLVRSRSQLRLNAFLFVSLFLIFIGLLFCRDGFAVDKSTAEIFMEPYKYLHNFLQMPLVFILFLLGVLSVLYGLWLGAFSKVKRSGFWFAGGGAFLVVFTLFLILGFHQTAYYPSVFDLQSSLTIQNSSSNLYTLRVMSYVSLFIPLVIAYVAYVWYRLSKTHVNKEELERDDKENVDLY